MVQNGLGDFEPNAELLQARRHRPANVPRQAGNDLVFPGLRGPFSGFGKAKAQLDEATGVTDWRCTPLAMPDWAAATLIPTSAERRSSVSSLQY